MNRRRLLLVLPLLSLVACKVVDQRKEGSADGLVTCGDGSSAFHVGEPCMSPGLCGDGTTECDGPFSTRCSSGPGGKESRVVPETCNGQDDDCDGDVDDGFDVGEPCTLAGGCVGIRACSDDHERAVCVVDEAALSPEICDGIDNDCDGLIDFTVGPTRLISACDCVEEHLTFGAVPVDRSIPGGEGLCDTDPVTPEIQRTHCDGGGSELAMTYCLDCSAVPYAMCESETTMNLTPFVLGEGGRALTVRFTFESDTAAKTPVNLYYTATYGTGRRTKQRRRYFPLVAVGDLPGSPRTAVFFPEHTCFARADETGVDCEGEETTCSACRPTDTCGLPTGADCDSLSFVAAQIQLAADLSACSGDSAGKVSIQEISYGPLSCDRQ